MCGAAWAGSRAHLARPAQHSTAKLDVRRDCTPPPRSASIESLKDLRKALQSLAELNTLVWANTSAPLPMAEPTLTKTPSKAENRCACPLQTTAACWTVSSAKCQIHGALLRVAQSPR